MERSQDHNRIVEYLRIKPVSHSQIYTSQIAVPETQGKEIIRERREALRRSLIEQGSNLIPLIVRPTEAYSNEEEYEVICGSDWCIVAKELGIEQMWAWVFEMTDEEVAAAQAQMEHLAPQPTQKTAQIETLLQQFELSFQKKVESLAKQIEQSVKKNEDLLKKQVKALTERNFESDRIEEIKRLLEQVEKTFHEKVDKLAKKIEQPGSDNSQNSAVISELNCEGALIQLDELEKLISIKLERTVQTINQFVADAIEDVENDLKNQIATLRSQICEAATDSEIQPETQRKKPLKTQRQKQSKIQQKPQLPQLQLSLPFAPQEDEEYENLSLRRLKAMCKDRKVRGYARMKRPEILAALREFDAQ
ncbi:Rho termination factor (modular protein) [Microcoleus sp. LEGE 07076]|uniref:Rho termination factor (modular protein) n=1 Tax=Microcoleus sp. LEGE 07076 TaxID=915322 RepID=UPI00187E2B70|nr:Rho termination factor (modular protein) [Microcoleus sp. LEGE 07076]MBE9183406.1 Rho termination factor (modular protein) [Microcoleus sp. LEGE 07076]